MQFAHFLVWINPSLVLCTCLHCTYARHVLETRVTVCTLFLAINQIRVWERAGKPENTTRASRNTLPLNKQTDHASLILHPSMHTVATRLLGLTPQQQHFLKGVRHLLFLRRNGAGGHRGQKCPPTKLV